MQILKNKLLTQDLEDKEEKMKGELEALSKREDSSTEKTKLPGASRTQEEYGNNIMSYSSHYLIKRNI